MTSQQWRYGEDSGPSSWCKDYPTVQSDQQSPINIVPAETEYGDCLRPLIVSYEHSNSVNISNNGSSVVVEYDDVHEAPVIEGGPLDDVYRLKQFHFHWGGDDYHGSEHTVDGKAYAAELHLVHWNTMKYKTFGESMIAPKGLAVLAVFLETGGEHEGLHKIMDALNMVKFKGKAADFKGFNPKCLLPNNHNYWTYSGSLTTPPLHESVTWILFKEPIKVSEKQMGKFRTLLFSEEGDDERYMENNFRSPQPLKGRKVYSSFRS
ncbi:carbonic anhydrase 7-like [Megalops cyprinoides]|uniref:carbonic anhydrase 7-like n=1 Tax=Megalops cyprinoides TaxID=118141 RepID=UPI001864B81E|nr:carbonic anhydrase 7-like [Megalops cyprinoides]